jgi:hypothetical protein
MNRSDSETSFCGFWMGLLSVEPFGRLPSHLSFGWADPEEAALATHPIIKLFG